MLLKDGGHHPIDLRRSQQQPAGNILAMRDALFGTAVIHYRSFAVDRAYLRRLSKSSLFSRKERAVLIHDPAGTIVAGWVSRRRKQLLSRAEGACRAGR
jgi:hypothetical protein